MREIVGIGLFAVPFMLIFIAAVKAIGWRDALMLFGAVAFGLVCMWTGIGLLGGRL